AYCRDGSLSPSGSQRAILPAPRRAATKATIHPTSDRSSKTRPRHAPSSSETSTMARKIQSSVPMLTPPRRGDTQPCFASGLDNRGRQTQPLDPSGRLVGFGTAVERANPHPRALAILGRNRLGKRVEPGACQLGTHLGGLGGIAKSTDLDHHALAG